MQMAMTAGLTSFDFRGQSKTNSLILSFVLLIINYTHPCCDTRLSVVPLRCYQSSALCSLLSLSFKQSSFTEHERGRTSAAWLLQTTSVAVWRLRGNIETSRLSTDQYKYGTCQTIWRVSVLSFNNDSECLLSVTVCFSLKLPFVTGKIHALLQENNLGI